MGDYLIIGSKATHYRSGVERCIGALISADLFERHEGVLSDLYDDYIFYTIGGDEHVEEDGRSFMEYLSGTLEVMKYIGLNKVDLDCGSFKDLLDESDKLTGEEVDEIYLDSRSNESLVENLTDNYEEVTLYLPKNNVEVIKEFANYLNKNEDKVQDFLSAFTLDDLVKQLNERLK